MSKESEPTTPRFLGLSRDGRAGRWEVQCPSCGKWHKPETCLSSKQRLTCPKCGAELLADYNAEVVEVYHVREQ